MASSTTALSLGMVPQEVLEHIALFAATDGILGPPAGIVPLLALNRATHDALSFTNNPHLYARIFAEKYDTDAAARRLGLAALPATALAEELQRRSLVLKRIRKRIDDKFRVRVRNVCEVVILLELGFCDEIVVIERTEPRKGVRVSG